MIYLIKFLAVMLCCCVSCVSIGYAIYLYNPQRYDTVGLRVEDISMWCVFVLALSIIFMCGVLTMSTWVGIR